MKRVALFKLPLNVLFVLACLVSYAGVKPCAEIVLVEPKDKATVALLLPGHKEWLGLPREERLEKFADVNGYRKKMAKTGTRPQGVRLVWHCQHEDGKPCAGTYAVEVMKRRTGQIHFAAENLKTNVVILVNLEAGEEYTWSVWCGEKVNGARFQTEDVAPRLLDWEGVPNVRDLGGWKTRDGRRVRQGLVFRSSGLNDNAHTFLSNEDVMKLHEAGQLEPLFGAKGKEIAEKLDSGKMKPDDPALHKTFRCKTFEKGKLRGTEASREYVRTFFGLRTDIDLRRTESECWGMTESPLGPSVTWLNLPGQSYGGLGTENGKKAFKKTFGVFLDRARYGIVFHCIGGADRTGAVAFILNGLLGVEEEDLWKDWEFTAFGGQGSYFLHKTHFLKLLKVFDDYPGETINNRIEAYVKSLGFTDADIETLREILLEDDDVPADLRGLPVWRTADGVANLRDLGGWPAMDGCMVRTGCVYRAATLDRVTDRGRETMTQGLGIVTDLDLRRAKDIAKLNGKSPLGVTLENLSSPSYDGFGTEDGRKSFARTFRWLINEAHYPLVFHCQKGADRTGSWAFFLNGLLGVQEADLRYDWEVTAQSNRNPLFKHRGRYDELRKIVEACSGETWSEKFVGFAQSCGVTDVEIGKWRAMMLEKRK